jgi:hypothetical protein
MGERLIRGRPERSTGGPARREVSGVPEPAPAWDDASEVLPPTDDVPESPDERGDGLWHTATVASVAPVSTPRRRLSLALGALAAATLLVSGYAGVQFAGMVGLLPPSPPRYVVLQDQPAQNARAGGAQHRVRPIVVTFGPGFAVHHDAAEVGALLNLVRRETEAQLRNVPKAAPARVPAATRTHSRGSDRDSDDDDDDDDRDDEDD